MPTNTVDWSQLLGGDRQPYDPRSALEAWSRGDKVNAPGELWNKLYHQGDVDTASYAAVPGIAEMIASASAPDWNAYALMASIEEGRLSKHNPPVPAFLENQYRSAWSAIIASALRDLANVSDGTTVLSILAVLAHAKGQHSLAAIALCTEDERQIMLLK